MWDVDSFKRIKCFINKVHLESQASGTLVNSLPPTEFLLGCACLLQPRPASSRLTAQGFALAPRLHPHLWDTCLVQFLGTFDICRICFAEGFSLCVCILNKGHFRSASGFLNYFNLCLSGNIALIKLFVIAQNFNIFHVMMDLKAEFCYLVKHDMINIFRRCYIYYSADSQISTT